MIRSTSLKAYYQDVLPTLGKRHKSVLRALLCAKRPVTNTELAKHLGWSINTVTPRCKELREKGIVKEGDKRKCSVTGRTCCTWYVRKKLDK